MKWLRSAVGRPVACLAVAICTLPKASVAAPTNAIESNWNYVLTVYHYFARPPLYAIPLFVAGDRESGDVLALPDWHLDEKRTKCFPGLPAAKLQPGSLPTLEISNSKALDGAVSASAAQIGRAAVSADYAADYKVSLSYLDGAFDESSEGDLRRHYSHAACPFLANTMAGVLDGKHALIGTVLWGRRKIDLIFARARAGAADVGLVARLKALANIDVKVSGGDANSSIVELQDSATAPVAFRPMYVSYDDLLRREFQMQKGMDREIEDILNSAPDARSVANAVKGKPQYTERPEAIASAMQDGKSAPTGSVKPDQISRYFRFIGDLIVTSLIYYRFQ